MLFCILLLRKLNRLFNNKYVEELHNNGIIKIPEFLGYMNTPILKAKKGKKERSFYTLNAFEEWKSDINGISINTITSMIIKFESY